MAITTSRDYRALVCRSTLEESGDRSTTLPLTVYSFKHNNPSFSSRVHRYHFKAPLVPDQGCEPLLFSSHSLKLALATVMSAYCLHLHGIWKHQGPKQLHKNADVSPTLVNEYKPSSVGKSVAHSSVSVAPARILCIQDAVRFCTIPEST